MRKLAQRGIDIMNEDSEGVNVLHLSVYKNHRAIFKMLLSSGFPLIN